MIWVKKDNKILISVMCFFMNKLILSLVVKIAFNLMALQKIIGFKLCIIGIFTEKQTKIKQFFEDSIKSKFNQNLALQCERTLEIFNICHNSDLIFFIRTRKIMNFIPHTVEYKSSGQIRYNFYYL
jgi:hypothetical protein